MRALHSPIHHWAVLRSRVGQLLGFEVQKRVIMSARTEKLAKQGEKATQAPTAQQKESKMRRVRRWRASMEGGGGWRMGEQKMKHKLQTKKKESI